MAEEKEISFWDVVPEISPELAEKLFPELPEGYFTPENPGLQKKRPKLPDSGPYVGIVDLNQKDSGEREDIRPKRAVEVGWSWSF